MIDAEVIRLRRLRNTVLRARAIARVLDSRSGRPHSVFGRSALDCWRIARVITGKLRAHPYLAYQQGPGDLRTIYNHITAKLVGGRALRQGRAWRRFALELQRVSRELDDVRALTWSSELSDTLGRSQMYIRRLVEEVDAAACKEGGSTHQPVRIETPLMANGNGRDDSSSGPVQWPYLAI
jgi:hypothetical protein